MIQSNVSCSRTTACRELLQTSAKPSAVDLDHLADCPICQQALESSVADAATWDLVSDTLRENVDAKLQPFGKDPMRRSSVHSQRFQASAVEQEWLESELRELLPPPRQPDFLARLGRYDVERLIGRGGMGLVFRAHDSQLNRVVAIKILAPHLSRMGVARQRFAREARAVAAVVHPHIVAIHDVVSESDPPFLVMQLVVGPSLQQLIDANGPLPSEQIVRLAIQICEALSAAHEQGLIHRDIKPGNILLEADGQRALLTDFGLVRTLDDATLTHSGVLAGTPHYMSPEQARGEDVDERSDLFALGSVLYHLCTGRPPFRAPQPLAILHRVCHERHRPIHEIRRDISWRLAATIDRLLSKKAVDRFASAEKLRTELLRVQRGEHQPVAFRIWGNVARNSIAFKFAGVAALIAVLVCGRLFFQRDSFYRNQTLESNATVAHPSVEESTGESSVQPTLSATESVSTSSAGFANLNLLEQRIDRVRGKIEALKSELENRLPIREPRDPEGWDKDAGQLGSAIQEYRNELAF